VYINNLPHTLPPPCTLFTHSLPLPHTLPLTIHSPPNLPPFTYIPSHLLFIPLPTHFSTRILPPFYTPCTLHSLSHYPLPHTIPSLAFTLLSLPCTTTPSLTLTISSPSHYPHPLPHYPLPRPHTIIPSLILTLSPPSRSNYPLAPSPSHYPLPHPLTILSHTISSLTLTLVILTLTLSSPPHYPLPHTHIIPSLTLTLSPPSHSHYSHPHTIPPSQECM